MSKFRECEISIPKELVGGILLALIKVLGYKLLIKWDGGNGSPMIATYKLEKLDKFRCMICDKMNYRGAYVMLDDETDVKICSKCNTERLVEEREE